MDNQIEKAIQIIKQGGIIIFPTDTAFGIGCHINNEAAVKRLFAARNRPESKATPVLVDTVTMAQKYLDPIPEDVVSKLIEPYWPGALTIVLKSKTDVLSLVRGGSKTLGVRIPNHKTARAIIRGVGAGILGPSANMHGEKTPYTFADLDPEIIKKVDFVVEGECLLKQASTVVDCTTVPWTILRNGVIKLTV